MTRLILIFGFFFILFIHENQSYVPNPYFYGVRIGPLIGNGNKDNSIGPLIGNGNKDNSKYHWKIEFRCPDSGLTLKIFYYFLRDSHLW